MHIGPFLIWGAMQSNGARVPGRVIAALHWKRSITWSWGLYWSPWNGFTKRGFYKWGRLRAGTLGFNGPLAGSIFLQTQTPMWRR